MEDSAFVERLIARDPGAWSRFAREYGPLLVRAAASVVGEADAEDVGQTVCRLLVDNDARLLRSFQGRSTLSTWLVSIARHQALMVARRPRPPVRGAPEPASDPLEQVVRAEGAARLREALDALAPRERLLLSLHYRDGLSHAEIASVIGVSPNSVSPLLARALDRLKKKSL